VVHLNNAGSALMPGPVLDAMTAWLRLEAEIGGYEAADARRDEIEATYDAVARLVSAAPRNIALVENATVGFAQAMSAIPFQPGDTIVTSRNDYISNQLLFLSLRDRLGVRIARADDLPEGGVDPDSVRRLVRLPGVRVVAMTWVPTNSGLVQPLERVGAVCEEAGVPFVIDACQAVGQLPIDVSQLRCDYLSATARKFLRGPRGIGFLYVSNRALEQGAAPLFPDMQGARWTGPDDFELVATAKRFENWEFAFALVAGLGAAARYALEVGIERGGRRAALLAQRLRDALAAEDGVRVLDRGATRCAIATVAVDGRSGPDLLAALRRQRINTSVIRREHAIIDMTEKDAASGLRISPHYYNRDEEIDAAVAAIRAAARAPASVTG
jgi:selenocysteine lyase/cysteine desulfurase